MQENILEVKPRRYWQVRLGSKGKFWKECRDGGFIAISASGAREDIRNKSLHELEELIVRLRKENNRKTRDPRKKAKMYQRFLEISNDDVIVVPGLNDRILGIGLVRSAYRYDEGRADYAHIFDVDWLHVDEVTLPEDVVQHGVFIQDTVYELTDSRERLVKFVDSLVNLEDGSNDIEDAAAGGILGTTNLLHKAHGRPVSQEELAQARSRAGEAGRRGEMLVDKYLSSLCADSKIASFQWCSNVNAISPYDFELMRLDGSVCRVEVKSTEGAFDRIFHISTNELVTAAHEEVDYVIYRVFDMQDSSCKFCISENLSEWAFNILRACNSLPSEVTVDSYSARPCLLEFGPVLMIKH